MESLALPLIYVAGFIILFVIMIFIIKRQAGTKNRIEKEQLEQGAEARERQDEEFTKSYGNLFGRLLGLSKSKSKGDT